MSSGHTSHKVFQQDTVNYPRAKDQHNTDSSARGLYLADWMKLGGSKSSRFIAHSGFEKYCLPPRLLIKNSADQLNPCE